MDEIPTVDKSTGAYILHGTLAATKSGRLDEEAANYVWSLVTRLLLTDSSTLPLLAMLLEKGKVRSSYRNEPFQKIVPQHSAPGTNSHETQAFLLGVTVGHYSAAAVPPEKHDGFALGLVLSSTTRKGD